MTGQPQKSKLSKGAKVGIVAGVGIGALLLLRNSGQGDGSSAGEEALPGEGGGVGPLNNTGGGDGSGSGGTGGGGDSGGGSTTQTVDPCQAVGLTGTYPDCNWGGGPSGGGGGAGSGSGGPGPSTLDKARSLAGDPLFFLGATVGGPLAYKGIKKGYEISRGGKKGSPEREAADAARTQRRAATGRNSKSTETLAGRRTETIEKVPGVKSRVQGREVFGRSSRSVVNEGFQGARPPSRGPVRGAARDIIQQARGDPQQRGFTRGTLAAGAALEGLNAIAALPAAVDVSRHLQAAGYSNRAASGLATTSVLGGFQASQENIDYARAHPVFAVAKLSGEGAVTFAQGGLNNNPEEVQYARTHGYGVAVVHAIGTETVGIGSSIYHGASLLGGSTWKLLFG